MGLDEAPVAAVFDEWRTAPPGARLRAALRFVEKLTLKPAEMTQAAIAAAQAAGLSNSAPPKLACITCLFSVMDRCARAFDITQPTEKQRGATGSVLHRWGYRMAKLIR